MNFFKNKYKHIAVFLIAAILSGIFLPPAVSAEESVNGGEVNEPGESARNESEEKTQIKSVLPYVEKKENGESKNVPVESREDMTLNPVSVYLRVQVYLNAVDAEKYYGSQVHIFRLRPYQEVTDIASAQPAASFDVQSSEGFSYNVSLLSPGLSKLESGEIYNKFVAGVKDGDKFVPISEAQYISNINCLTNNGKREVPPVSKTKKGLSVQMPGEARLLGVGYTTVTIFLNDLMSAEENSNTEPYEYGGDTYYFNINKFAEYDKKIKYFTNEGINVTAVLLISADGFTPSGSAGQTAGEAQGGEEAGENGESGSPESLVPPSPVEYLIHPNALASVQGGGVKPFFYGINSTNENGVKYFEALMSFIADRYVKEDGGFGRIYNIILGTDIGRAMYNNCGNTDIISYVKDYIRALRICDTAVRSRFGGSRVYVPFDNWFTAKSQGEGDFTFTNKEIIDWLCEYSRKEGNFIWNVAWNAYNADLLRPECWLETAPLNDYSTPVITMKNINVLCDYINLEKKDYLPNDEIRKVMLSNQGFSSGDNSIESRELQAAAFVYAYLKVKYMPDITAFIYHGHVDNTVETALFGLWTNAPDTENEPGETKKIYDVFKYMDTNREADKIEFAKSILGIQDFTEIAPRYTTESEPAVILREVTGETVKKAKSLNATRIGIFNDAKLSGFMGSSNISGMSRVKYDNPDSEEFNGESMLFAGFAAPVKGDFGGIYKIYSSEESAPVLKDEKYIGVKLRIDTAIDMPKDQKIQLILIMESEPQQQSAGTAGETGATTSAGAYNAQNSGGMAGTYAAAGTASIFEGLANISPNKDEIVYFDISSWDDKTGIKRIKLLVNPYANYSSYQDLNQETQGLSPQSYVEGDDLGNSATSGSNTGGITGKYDFNLYIHSIVSAHNSKMSALQTFLTVAVIIIIIIAAAYGALYMRARIIKKKRREMRELQKRRAKAAASRQRNMPARYQPQTPSANNPTRIQRPSQNKIPPRNGYNNPRPRDKNKNRNYDDDRKK